MRARSYRLMRFFSVIILVVLGFVAGFALRGHPSFLQSLGLPDSITGITEPSAADAGTAQKDVYNSVAMRISEVEDILADDSMDTYSIDTVTTDSLKAFSDGSDDPYVRYYTPERYAKLLNNQDEGYAGVGVLFSEYNGQAYVVDVFEGSPAQLEGVQQGDFVVAVNGDRSQTWSRNEVAAVLSQEQGNTVYLDWRRPETLESTGGDEFTTALACEEYSEINVTSEYYEDRSVGYIKVKQFTQNASSFVQAEIESLTAQGARSFILDLRDNPGGYLSQAIGLSSLFMSGTIVEIKTKDGQTAKPATGQPVTASPLTVIVNKNTAAAAEVVAAALKEGQRATIVGTNTMGKGSVQIMHDLSFGGALRYTAAYYLTPAGRTIDQVGVTPDMTVGPTDEGDFQKDYAIELASSQVVVDEP